jgi:hypothetical protein
VVCFLLKADVVVAIFLLAIVLNVNTTISTLKGLDIVLFSYGWLVGWLSDEWI